MYKRLSQCAPRNMPSTRPPRRFFAHGALFLCAFAAAACHKDDVHSPASGGISSGSASPDSDDATRGDDTGSTQTPTSGPAPAPAPSDAPAPAPIPAPEPLPAPEPGPGPAPEPLPIPAPTQTPYAKWTDPTCQDPPLDQLAEGITFTKCDGSVGTGTRRSPKTSCRNLADLSRFDAIVPPARVGADIYDSIDDFNAGGALPFDALFGSPRFSCGPGEWRAAGIDSGTSPGFCNDADDQCAVIDELAHTAWTALPTSQPLLWQQAASACDALQFAGADDWRLPTQKELMAAYVHGIRSEQSPFFIADLNLWMWSSTTSSANKYVAWRVQPATGGVGLKGKKRAEAYALCVREAPPS